MILFEEEYCLRQQAKQFWFHNGDRNTKFFHNSIKARKRQNRITQIISLKGHISMDEGIIVETIRDYFNELFSQSASNFGELLGLVRPKVEASDNEMLTAEFFNAELRVALFKMDPNKAPGSYGLNPSFFQKN